MSLIRVKIDIEEEQAFEQKRENQIKGYSQSFLALSLNSEKVHHSEKLFHNEEGKNFK